MLLNFKFGSVGVGLQHRSLGSGSRCRKLWPLVRLTPVILRLRSLGSVAEGYAIQLALLIGLGTLIQGRPIFRVAHDEQKALFFLEEIGENLNGKKAARYKILYEFESK